SLAGLKALIEDQQDMAVVADANSIDSLLTLVSQLRPDVNLMDASLHGIADAGPIAQLLVESPDTEIAVISNYVEEHLAADAHAAGARGFLVNHDTPSDLFSCIRALATHLAYISPSARARMASRGLDLPQGLQEVRTLT